MDVVLMAAYVVIGLFGAAAPGARERLGVSGLCGGHDF